AYVVTAAGDSELFTFLEVDRSTESLRVIGRKAEAYIAYWQSGREQERHEVFPKVLFVVPDARRQAGVVDVLSRIDPELWKLFQVVTVSQAGDALSVRPPPQGRQYPKAM